MSETIINPIEDQQEDQYQGFRITDDHLAEWAIQKIKEAQGDTAKWQAHFAAQLEKIKAANQSTIDFMTGALGSYFATVPHKETKTQAKYDLPSATLIRKKQEPDFQRDADKLLAFLDAQKMDGFVKTVRSADWAALKAITTVDGEAVVIAETGEIVDGVKAVARPDKFDVKIKEADNAV
jgi:hypothetical protein